LIAKANAKRGTIRCHPLHRIYYDRSRQAGSPDPADEKVTVRVLTVMLAEEY